MKAVVTVLLAAAVCQGPRAVDGTQVKMDFERPTFWDAPFPSDELRHDGRIDLTRLETRNVPLVGQIRAIAARESGFATSGAIFFTLTGAPPATRLPSLAQSAEPDSPIFLAEVATGRRAPIEVKLVEANGPYGAANQLVLLPLQGVPLEPDTEYAAVVLRRVAEPALGASQTMAEIEAGTSTATAYVDAFRTLGLASGAVAGMAVFTTGRPTAKLAEFVAAARALPTATPSAPFVRTETFADYCVYESKVAMPVFQTGTPPYSSTEGTWPASAGPPDHFEDARVLLTVPRAPMPAAGWPLVDFIGAGAGGDRALVERGVWGADGGVVSGPGTGPAMHFARAGLAAVTIDGPLWGIRNTTHGDEDFLLFNLTNVPALRDNLRQSALELTLHPAIMRGLSLDVSDCPGATSPARFDAAHLAIFGHSMGATILPLAAANAPELRALVLSGAGASWIENIVYKQKPVKVLPAAELLADEPEGTMTAFDPVVTLVQWAAESADPQVYDALLSDRHVLMEQGIVDHYILPRIANATTLSLGLDVATPTFDASPELVDQQRAQDVLGFSGRSEVTLPAKTRLNVQHVGDGVQDGHEVIYQLEGPMHQYRCFLASWVRDGTPTVPQDGAADAPCP